MASYILYLFLSFFTADWAVSTDVAPGHTETPEERAARVDMIVAVVADEAVEFAKGSPFGAKALAAATLTKWHRESRFAHDVHAGFPGRYGSDRGRARGLGQIHVSGLVQRHEWEQLAGTDEESTRRCARATMRVLSAMARYCSTTELDVVFGAYGTGAGCRATESSRQRARRAQALIARL